MSRLALSLLVLFLGAVFCAVDSVEDLESVQLGTFEGSYSLPDGGFLYFCQDGVQVQGSWNEVGLIRGGADDTSVSGNFWSAGTGPCVLGTASFTLKSYGAIGNLTCNNGVDKINFVATKVSSYRPTDSQCGLIDESSKASVQGKWITNDQKHELNICFIDSNAVDYTAYGSLQRVDPDGNVLDWYFTGYWVDGGRILLGTWYEDFSAGAILFFVRNNGDIEFFWWTGLLYDQGQTYIDYNQLHNPYKHDYDVYEVPPGPPSAHQTASGSCQANEDLQDFVLNNLPRGQTNYYYYFVDVDYLDVDEIQYFRPLETNNNSSALSFCFVTLVFAALFALF